MKKDRYSPKWRELKKFLKKLIKDTKEVKKAEDGVIDDWDKGYWGGTESTLEDFSYKIKELEKKK